LEAPKRILITPLDWGLGHATRCIPLIKELQRRNCVIFIATSGRAYELLKKEFFLSIRIFEIDGYDPEYPDGDGMVFKMATQMGKFLRTIRKEQDQVEKIVERNAIDLVISDNRYGCYSTKVPSVIITHQLNIQMPPFWKWIEARVNKKNHEYINKFAECWVPAPEDSFIPSLTQNNNGLRVRNIGYLSRFQKQTLDKKYDICAICSGPEPQRSNLDYILTSAFKKSPLQTLLVCGKTEILGKYYKKDQRFSIANSLTTEDLNEVIEQSDIIIARPGYSTVMDLAKLGKRAIFIPTPGQTEQQVLAEELMKRGIAYYMNQDDFDLETALKESQKFTGFANFGFDESLLQKAVTALLNEEIAK
jgi:uncharacterized protein (TIGR00661 family)